ncbi:MAG TPA: patatin-like phospholipase family protein, partial [Rectinemataceae bacterium]|nr:patatin-like phospholipase family protein [Rectinemataceae bacterium]
RKGYCLVLSGGGAKGVYHLGVWKALKELGIDVQAFIGTSIGAVIAGLLAQDSDDTLDDLGDSITVDSIIALPETFTEEGKINISRDSLSKAQELFRSVMENKGLDTSPLRRLLLSRIDEAEIRKSGKDLGVVTINLSNFKPREMFIEEMEEGTIIDYLMASAAFPGFHQPVIEGKKYMDGGIFDNIPYGMARQRGYRRVIISDISGLGRNRRPEIEGSLTVYIKNSINMGGVLDFDRQFMKDFERLGYLDTMRIFGRLKGYSYFIEPDKEAEEVFAVARNGEAGTLPAFPKAMLHDKDLLLKYLECAVLIVEVPRIRDYHYGDLSAAIAGKKAEDEKVIADLLKGGADMRAAIVAMLRESVTSRSFKGSPYYYYRLIEEFAPKTAGAMLRKALISFFPELPAGMDYFRLRDQGFVGN